LANQVFQLSGGNENRDVGENVNGSKVLDWERVKMEMVPQE